MGKTGYCKICLNYSNLIFHHVDYNKNIGIMICHNCHYKIHSTNILCLLKYKPIGERKQFESREKYFSERVYL